MEQGVTTATAPEASRSQARLMTPEIWRRQVKRLRKITGLLRVPPNFTYEGKMGWHMFTMFPCASEPRRAFVLPRGGWGALGG